MDLEFLVLASRCQPHCDHGFPTDAWVGILFVGGLILIFVLGIRSTSYNGPKIKGPALTGTARVLKMRYSGNKIRCHGDFTLRVETPGYQPYDVTIRQPFPSELYTRLYRQWVGRTVAVLVDSTDPQRVRIDFNQPIW